jgi:hypothetical protein
MRVLTRLRVAGDRLVSKEWRLFLSAVGGAVFLTATLAGWLAIGFAGARATVTFDDLVETLVPVAVAVVCWLASRRNAGQARRAWLLLGGASLSWGVGQGIWTLYEVVLHRQPFPSLADPFYLGLVPLAAAALLAFPSSPQSLATRVRTLIDGLIMWGSLLFVSWALLLGPVYRASSATMIAKLLSIGYPAGDVVLTGMVLIVAARARRSGPFVLISAGLVALALADSMFGFLSLQGSYGSGNALDASWVAGFLLIGLAALWPTGASAGAHEERHTRLAAMLPYAAFPPALIILGLRLVRGQHTGPFLAWVGLATMVLVLARQMLALVDNLSLPGASQGPPPITGGE